VTIANRPSSEAGRESYSADSGFGKTEIFLQRGLDSGKRRAEVICPSGDPIRPGGPTMKETINRIYGEGRSRTIHGTNEKLGYDWSSVRGLAEQFARMCSMACIDWGAKNPAYDDPSLLVK
jgi:hypothetical protein